VDENVYSDNSVVELNSELATLLYTTYVMAYKMLQYELFL